MLKKHLQSFQKTKKMPCDKQSYSQAKATKALQRMKVNCRVYRCKECGYWHITKINQDLQKKLANKKYQWE